MFSLLPQLGACVISGVVSGCDDNFIAVKQHLVPWWAIVSSKTASFIANSLMQCCDYKFLHI